MVCWPRCSWHRRKAAAAARGEVLTYDSFAVPEGLELPLARCEAGQPSAPSTVSDTRGH